MISFQRKKWTMTIIVLAGAFSYAIIRYNIIKGTPWEHFPLLISNKAISLSSVAFIALSYLLGPLARFWPTTIVPLLRARRFFGLLGFGLAALHGLISLLLFSPANYPKFFSGTGALNLIGELSMLFGVLAFLLFTMIASTGIPFVADSMQREKWQLVQHLGYLGLFLILLHVVAMGFEGWMMPGTWPGGLLPISLIASIILVTALLLRCIVLISPGEYDARHPRK